MTRSPSADGPATQGHPLAAAAMSAVVSAELGFAGLRPDACGEEAQYFDHCQQGRLTIQRCDGCEAHVFYPRSVCPHCWRRQLRWVDAGGRGRVHTFTVQYREPPGFEGQAPFVIAIIELTEGVQMMSRVVAPHDSVEIGMPVRVAFARIAEGFQVPVFLPDDQGAADGA